MLKRAHSIDKIMGRGSDIVKTDYPERYRILGLKIAYYRKRAGYTQEAFAEKIGRSNNFISQVEGVGTTKGVSLETLFKMAEVLGVPAGELLEEDQRGSIPPSK